MADPRALYESMSRRGIEGSRADAARRRRAVILALVGIFLVIAVATQFMNAGSARHPMVVEQSQRTDTN